VALSCLLRFCLKKPQAVSDRGIRFCLGRCCVFFKSVLEKNAEKMTILNAQIHLPYPTSVSDRGIRFTWVVEQGSRKKMLCVFFTDIAFQPLATMAVN
jgi:hypothetical protein